MARNQKFVFEDFVRIELSSLFYDGISIDIEYNGFYSEDENPCKFNVYFSRIFHFLLIEDALSSLFKVNDMSNSYFINEWKCGEHEISRAMKMDFYPFYEISRHYEICALDEIVHVFTNEEPIIRNSQARKNL